APELVAEVTGEERAERPEEEGDADGDEREDLRDALASGREEELREDEIRHEGVDEEVVPLDGGADDDGCQDFVALPGGGLVSRAVGHADSFVRRRAHRGARGTGWNIYDFMHDGQDRRFGCRRR